MNKKEKTNIKRKFTNLIGAFGYLFCMLQWVWTILLYFTWIQSIALFINNTNNQVDKPVPVAPVVGSSGLDPISIVVAVVVTTLVIALTIYIFIKLPSMIARIGRKIVHETAEFSAPLIIRAQHKKDTKKFHLQLTSRLIVVLKIMLVIIPLVVAYTSQLLEKQVINFSIAMYVSFGLAGISVVFFVFQYLIASLLAVKRQDLW